MHKDDKARVKEIRKKLICDGLCHGATEYREVRSFDLRTSELMTSIYIVGNDFYMEVAWLSPLPVEIEDAIRRELGNSGLRKKYVDMGAG